MEPGTDAGLSQFAEILIIARPLNMRLVRHLETAEWSVFCLMMEVTVSASIWSSVAGCHYNSLLEVDEKQMVPLEALG